MVAESLLDAGAGGILGGALGGLGDVLSAPRRGLWSVLGMPEHGNELVANMTGLDKNAMLAQALGFGAEILGDPLTYAGALAGGPLTKLFGRATMSAPVAAEEIAALTAARRAAQSGLVDRAALEADTLAGQMGRVPGFAGQDIAGIAGNQVQTPRYIHNPALQELGDAGLARTAANPNLPQWTPVPGKAGLAVAPAYPAGLPHDVSIAQEVLGRTYPPGYGQVQMRGNQGGTMVGSALRRTDPDAVLPYFAPDELKSMADISAAQPGGWQGLEQAGVGGLGERGLMEEVMRRSAADMNASRAMPTLHEAMGGNMPRSWNDALGTSMPSMRLPQAFDETQKALAAALARQKAAKLAYEAATTLNPLEEYSAIGAGALGGYSAGMMGNEMMRGR